MRLVRFFFVFGLWFGFCGVLGYYVFLFSMLFVFNIELGFFGVRRRELISVGLFYVFITFCFLFFRLGFSISRIKNENRAGRRFIFMGFGCGWEFCLVFLGSFVKIIKISYFSLERVFYGKDSGGGSW